MKYVGARENEVFVGNTPKEVGIGSHLAELKTVRLGEQALDIDGKKIDDCLPVFIDRSEEPLYDRIMMKLTFPNQAYYPPACFRGKT